MIEFEFLFQDINTTHSKVVQSLAECEVAKHSFLQLKEKAEHILKQLKEDDRKQQPSTSNFSTAASPLYAQVNKQRSKQSALDDRRGSLPSPVSSPARNSVAGGGLYKDDLRMDYHLRPRSLFIKKD